MSSARSVTLPSEVIELILISLFALARLIRESFSTPLVPPFVAFAVIVPSIFVLIDFVQSLAPVSSPVETSSPIAPFSTMIIKLS